MAVLETSLHTPADLSPEDVDRLLPSTVWVVARLGERGGLHRLLAQAPAGLRPLLLGRAAEGGAVSSPDGARALLAQCVPAPGDSHALAGQARALFVLGDRAAADGVFVQALRAAGEVPARQAQLLADHLAVGDGVGALGVLRASGAAAGDRAVLSALLEQLRAAGQLTAGLEVLSAVEDVLERYVIVRDAMRGALAARDEAGCLLLLQAAPRVYWEELLRLLVLGFLDARMLGAAARAAALWRDVDVVGIAHLGALALVGEGESVRPALSAHLAERLAQDEVAYSDVWVYRELGRACGWSGDVAGALSALERVADHEDRLRALLDAAVYAPSGACEALLCAARGLVVGLQGERSRAEAAAQLGMALARLGRQNQARSLFATASQDAAAIRRPRGDQGATRRAALSALAHAQVAVGEYPGAYQTARRLRTPHHRNPILQPCALAYARAGDLAGAALCLEAVAPTAARLTATVSVLSAWLDADGPARQAQQDSAA